MRKLINFMGHSSVLQRNSRMGLSLVLLASMSLVISCVSTPLTVIFGPSDTATPSSTATSTVTPTSTPTPTPIVVGPVEFPVNVNPLTGLTIDDPSILNRRPVFVKVTNFPRTARPQAGLSSADIVFDYYTGSGVDRFAAIFYGQDSDLVGPIRSGRLVDAQLVPMYQGILSCGSADQISVWPTLLNEIGYYRIFIEGSNSCPAMCRDESIPEHVNSLFANTAELTKWAIRRNVDAQERLNLDGMYFNTTPPASINKADFVALNFFLRNRAEWQFDAVSGRYLKWIEQIDENDQLSMIPHVDRITNEQLAFSNVVVIIAQYIEYSESLHDIVLTAGGSGKAFLFRDGNMMEGRWRVFNRYQPLQFLDTNGDPLAFKPGNSWIMIAGQQSIIKEETPGHWEVQFYLP